MFLKNSLEKKLQASLAQYEEEKALEKSNERKSHSHYSTHDRMNFTLEHRLYNDDVMKEKAKIAKKYVKELIDPDILEIQKKRWNISNLPNNNEKPELKKTLFEVRHGFKDYQVVKLKERKIELGTDSRNFRHPNWNDSALFENYEKKMILQQK
jgi:uncharacterized membrane-anchored protein YjiN (DUF445 family)